MYLWLWSLRDGKKINLEDGRVEIVSDGKTRKLIFKVDKNDANDDDNVLHARTPTLRTPEKSVSRQTRIPPLVSSKWHVSWNRRYIHGLFLRRYKLKEKPTKFLPPQMRMVLWRQWSSLLMSLSVNRFLFSNSSTFATVPSSLFSFKWISSGDPIQLSLWICSKMSSSYCCHCPGCVSCGSERPRRTSRLLHQWEKGKTHFIQS